MPLSGCMGISCFLFHYHDHQLHPLSNAWLLTKYETIISFESLPKNLIYVLPLDKNFTPFQEAKWQIEEHCNNMIDLSCLRHTD